MKVSRHIIFFCFSIFFCSLSYKSQAQPGHTIDIKKPAPYDNRVLKAEKTGTKKLKPHKRFFQNLTTHYNYVFNANVKLNEILERAKANHADDFSELLPFYNYNLETTRRDSIQIDSIIYKSQTGIVMHDLRNDWIDDLYLLWGAAYFLRNQLDSATMMFQFINHAFAEKEKDGYYIPIGTHKEGENSLTISSKEKKGLLARASDRNDAFIWRIKALLEANNYSESASLINTLKNDPFFPKRLELDLEEVTAHLFYKQRRWDSSASHLSLAAEGADSKKEKARWEYLAAQMYELAGKKEDAAKMYTSAISHTSDPVMEVYARLNLVRLNKGTDDSYIDRNIAELLKMAKRDKYEDYRDVIYYMAAQMEMERNNTEAAQELLLKGAKYNNGNNASKNKAFLKIADLSYDQKKYIQAASYYDSLKINDLTDVERERVNERRPVAAKIASNQTVVTRQDSLQKIAALPEAERTALLNRMAKQIRKQQGLKDEPVTAGNANNAAAVAPDLFNNNQKGDWYFYNNTLKTRGAEQFKQIWGTRPNVDNWRRYSVVNQQMVNVAQNAADVNANNNAANTGVTSTTLEANLPLTAESMNQSNDSIKNALHNLGSIYLNEANDYQSAINVLEELRRRFPDFTRMDEALFNLYYAYTKAGNAGQAAQIKRLLNERYGSTKYASIVNTGKDPSNKSAHSPEATKEYESIYNTFLEGRFNEALEAKKRADSVYKTNTWQPQLLYIEAVYHAKERDDSAAKLALQTLIAQERNTPIGKKGEALLNVISRRAQIENELANYQMQNEQQVTTPPQNVVSTPPPVTQTQPPVKTETVLPKTDVAVQKPAETTPIQKPIDTVAKKPVINTPPPVAGFTFKPEAQHFALVLLTKVDPVFVNEAKNAFARFSKEKFHSIPLDVNFANFNSDVRLLLIGNFPNAQAATDYVDQAKRQARTDIIPWLTADKYHFSIITSTNLEVLQANQDLISYKKFIDQHFPGKF